MGKGSNESITSDDYRVLLQEIKNDKSIDAVVLRVNSPGGSALASDIIWREIELLKKEKPAAIDARITIPNTLKIISANKEAKKVLKNCFMRIV